MESQIRLAGDLKPGLAPDLHASSRLSHSRPPTRPPQFRPVPPSLPGGIKQRETAVEYSEERYSLQKLVPLLRWVEHHMTPPELPGRTLFSMGQL